MKKLLLFAPLALLAVPGLGSAAPAAAPSEAAVPAAREDVETIVAELNKKRDEADPKLIEQLADLQTREAMQALVKAYDESFSSIFMRREVISALQRFDGVAEAEQPALQKISDIATEEPIPELHEAALDALGQSRSLGKYFLRLIVDSSAENPIRVRAMKNHLELSGEEDLEWYEELFEKYDPVLMREEDKQAGKKKKKPKKGEEPEQKVHGVAQIRELALERIAGKLDEDRLIELAKDRPEQRDRTFPNAYKLRQMAMLELERRESKKIEEVAEKAYEDGGEFTSNRVIGARILARIHGVKMAPKFLEDGRENDSIMPLELRLALADQLAEWKDEATGKKLAKLVGKGKTYEKLFVLRAVRYVEDPKLNKNIVKLLVESRKDSERALSRDLVIAAADALADRKAVDQIPALQGLIEKSKDSVLIAACLDAMTALRVGDAGWITQLEGYTKHEDAEVRNAAIEELSDIDPKAYQSQFVESLSNEAWSTRVAALKALEKSRTREATGAIVARMSEEVGFMLHRFADVLFNLTGEPHRLSADRWQRWWADQGADFDPISLSKLDELRKEEELRRLKAIYDVQSSFFGIRILSKRVIFILDVSGSMNDPTQGEFVGVDGPPRIDVAKRELKRAIENLEDESLFNVIVFSSDVERWLDGGISESNGKTREEATSFVDRLGANGGTNLYGSLADAFADEDVDMIMLLSDGEPSVGEETDPFTIRERVAQWNEHRGIVVHCIAVGGSFQVLEWIAEDSGGQYVRFD